MLAASLFPLWIFSLITILSRYIATIYTVYRYITLKKSIKGRKNQKPLKKKKRNPIISKQKGRRKMLRFVCFTNWACVIFIVGEPGQGGSKTDIEEEI